MLSNDVSCFVWGILHAEGVQSGSCNDIIINLQKNETHANKVRGVYVQIVIGVRIGACHRDSGYFHISAYMAG